MPFWITFIKTFRKIYTLPGCEEVRILPLFLVMTSSRMTSSRTTRLPNLHIFMKKKSYQPTKFQWLSESDFTEERPTSPSATPVTKTPSAYRVKEAFRKISPNLNCISSHTFWEKLLHILSMKLSMIQKQACVSDF